MIYKIAFIFALAATSIGAVRADDASMVKLSGFGTLGVSHSSESRGDYVVDYTVPKGAGRSHSWDWGNDTRLGLNASADLAPKVTAVLQVLSEYQSDGSYSPVIDWANIKYAFSPDSYVRLGRIALPTFLNSDTREVGYSYPWVRPPVELYRQLVITNSDGVDGMFRFEVNDATNTIRAIAGTNKLSRPTGTTTSRNIWGIFDTFDYGAAVFRAGYQERQSSSYSQLTGVTGAWITNSDLSLGASYDPGKWFAMSEWIKRESNTRRNAMALSAGMRLAKFTPYVLYTRDSPSTVLPGAVPPVLFVNNSQHTFSTGSRWDFARNADLKLQYDLVRLSSNSNGNLANVPAGVALYGSQFHVISLAADFLF